MSSAHGLDVIEGLGHVSAQLLIHLLLAPHESLNILQHTNVDELDDVFLHHDYCVS